MRVRGQIDPSWSDWLAGLTATPTPEGDTVLSFNIVDQAALYGLLNRVSDLGLKLISLTSTGTDIGT